MSIECQAEMSPAEDTLPQVLLRVADELHDAAALIERVEPQILALAGPNAVQSAEAISAMQGIDLAVQKARGLAEFIDTLAAAVPDSCIVDLTTALNLVSLADLQKALRSDARGGDPAPLGRAAGDFEFF